jgi:hypothetical protein
VHLQPDLRRRWRRLLLHRLPLAQARRHQRRQHLLHQWRRHLLLLLLLCARRPCGPQRPAVPLQLLHRGRTAPWQGTALL